MTAARLSRSHSLQKSNIRHTMALCMMGALAMSFGWGFRGDYGHEAGAMVPGALLAIGICLVSGREDWFYRTAVAGLCGALGWAFGGQMSYGQITSYTVSHSFPDVFYGYACLFTVGMLWGGIGGAILSLAFTESRSQLRHFIGPLVAVGAAWLSVAIILSSTPVWGKLYEGVTENVLHDTDWLQASLAFLAGGIYWLAAPRARRACSMILYIAAGWWLGYLVLVWLFGLHMSPTPPGSVRSDNWAGCVGILAGLLLWLRTERNRAGLMLTLYGALAGGLGFALGDFINKPDKVHWEPFYQHTWLHGFDHWKWSEQSFGLFMGFGVALGLLRLLRGNLAAPNEDEPGARPNDFAVFFLLVPMLWLNLHKNILNWAKPNIQAIPDERLLGLPPALWFLIVGLLLTALVGYAMLRHRRRTLPLAPATALGKGQVLFLGILWVAALGALLQAFPGLHAKGILFVHASFWLTAIACSWLALRPAGAAITWSATPEAAADARCWRVGWRHWALWGAAVALLVALTALTLAMHDAPMPGSALRFGPNAYHCQ